MEVTPAALADPMPRPPVIMLTAKGLTVDKVHGLAPARTTIW